MTIGVDGNDCRCLVSGFLSHFDWKDNHSIFIWGKESGNIDNLRSNPFLSNHYIQPFLSVAKNVIRSFSKKAIAGSKHFLLVQDVNSKQITPLAIGVIDEDGHPMCCPVDRDIVICDTYPNQETKERTLFFYDFRDNTRIDIGHFYMGNSKVDVSLENEYIKDVDSIRCGFQIAIQNWSEIVEKGLNNVQRFSVDRISKMYFLLYKNLIAS